MTDAVRLIEPTEHHRQLVMDYRQEFVTHGDTLHGTGGLERTDSFDEWLKGIAKDRHPDTVAHGRVVATQFLAVRSLDNRIVGMIQVRHDLNDYLLQFGGHIGYSVRPTERRKGYATKMLALALDYCHQMGLTKVLITCDKTNPASASVIVANGGTLENEVLSDDGITFQRYWIVLK